MKRQSSARYLSASCQSRLKRVVSATILLTIVILLINLMTIATSAATFTGSDGVPLPPDSQSSFEAWLKASGWPPASRYRGYPASYETWRDYGLLVYGRPSQVSGNRYDSGSNQYASLGYSYDELIVTNSLFPDDSPGGVTRTSPWQWQQLDMGQSARISWARLNDRQKAFIRQSELTYRNNRYGGMTFEAMGLTDKNTVVLAPPSWHLGFALYTNHYRPGSTTDLRYATFNGRGAGDVILSSSIQLMTPTDADGCLVIDALADFLDIDYAISGSIEGYNGLASAQDIRSRGAGRPGAWIAGSGDGPWIAPAVIRVKREDLDESGMKVLTLSGQAWVVSHMGDICLSQVEMTIPVRAETPAAPFAVDVQVNGAISYFNGRTNSLGQVLPLNPLRFLGLEKIHIVMTFSREPGSIQCTLSGTTVHIEGSPGITRYETSLIVPLKAGSLDWSGQRIRSPWTLEILATERAMPSNQIAASVHGIEVTGTVYDIAHIQIGP